MFVRLERRHGPDQRQGARLVFRLVHSERAHSFVHHRLLLYLGSISEHHIQDVSARFALWSTAASALAEADLLDEPQRERVRQQLARYVTPRSANMRHLLKALAELRSGQSTRYQTVDELWRDLVTD